jgi:hypothetical protein
MLQIKHKYRLLFLLAFFNTLLAAQPIFYDGGIKNCCDSSDQISSPKHILQLDTNTIGKIEICSFKASWLMYNDSLYSAQSNQTAIIKRKKINWHNIGQFSMNNLAVYRPLLKEFKEISNAKDKSKIMQITLNKYIGPSYGKTDFSLCYEPRNGVVFYNKQNKILLILEICFECNNQITIRQNNSYGGVCEETIKELHLFFEQKGIEFGITKK